MKSTLLALRCAKFSTFFAESCSPEFIRPFSTRSSSNFVQARWLQPTRTARVCCLLVGVVIAVSIVLFCVAAIIIVVLVIVIVI